MTTDREGFPPRRAQNKNENGSNGNIPERTNLANVATSIPNEICSELIPPGDQSALFIGV